MGMTVNRSKFVKNLAILLGVGLLVFFIVFTVCLYLTIGDMEQEMSDIKNESDYTPVVVVSGKAYVNDNKYNLYECIKNYNKDYQFYRALCMHNNRIYVCVHGSNKTEYIASIGIEEMDLLIHSQIENIDNAKFTDECVMYNEGVVTITNGVNVLEYDILNNESKVFDAADYNFQEKSNDYSISVNSSEKIELNYKGEFYTFEFSEIAQNSIGASKLYNYKTKKTWDGDSCFAGLYVSDSWKSFDDRIYSAVKCKSFDGTLFASIIEYDTDENKWVYVCGGYDCGGSVEGDYFFNIIPIV